MVNDSSMNVYIQDVKIICNICWTVSSKQQSQISHCSIGSCFPLELVSVGLAYTFEMVGTLCSYMCWHLLKPLELVSAHTQSHSDIWGSCIIYSISLTFPHRSFSHLRVCSMFALPTGVTLVQMFLVLVLLEQQEQPVSVYSSFQSSAKQ